MKYSFFRCLFVIIAFFISLITNAREDSWPQDIPADLPLYTKGTPRIHYNLVPQYNLAEDNLSGPVDSCAVYRMTVRSEWGEKSIVKDYLWRETTYTPQGYRKQRKQYYLYEGNRDKRYLEFIENYTGAPNINSISVINYPESSHRVDTYTFTVKDDYHKNVLLTRASGELSMWKSIIDPPNGLFKLEYFAHEYSDPDVTYTNFFESVYTHEGSNWRQTLKNLFNEREIMHTNTPVYAYNDGIFLVPPYSGKYEYNLFQNNDTHKIVRISPIQSTINEGIASVKRSSSERGTAYCTIDLEYNSHGDYSKISFVKHDLVKHKNPNGSISYSWDEQIKWYVTWEYEYDSHGNWTLLKFYRYNAGSMIDSPYESTRYYSREIFYSGVHQDDNLAPTNLSIDDILKGTSFFTDGLEYPIESTESPNLIASIDNGIFVCAISSDDEQIIRVYNRENNKWSSLKPVDWDCDYCWFKDFRLVGENLYLILSTHANGAGGTCCSYDVYKFDLKTNILQEIIGCACECEIVDNKIKATILELVSGDNWLNYKYNERTEWIELE